MSALDDLIADARADAYATADAAYAAAAARKTGGAT